MIKVWLKGMQTDMSFRSEWQTTLDFSAIIDRHDTMLRDRAYDSLRLGKPLFLVSEDELGGKREIERLRANAEILTAERDAAMARVTELKVVAKSLLDRF